MSMVNRFRRVKAQYSDSSTVPNHAISAGAVYSTEAESTVVWTEGGSKVYVIQLQRLLRRCLRKEGGNSDILVSFLPHGFT